MLSLSIVFFISLIFYGYAYIFKNVFLKIKSPTEKYDYIYGILLLIFISTLLNFFIKISLISEFIILIGLCFFLYGYIKRQIKIDLLKLLFLNFFFIFISFDNSPIGDTNFYHLQTIKWISEYKISFGLVNIEDRLAYSTLWPNLLSIINIKLFNHNIYYLINLSVFSIFFLNIISIKRINSLGDLLIIFSGFFVLCFSLIHPDKNGIMLNYLGSVEYDSIIFLLFITVISLFLSLNKSEKIVLEKYILISSISLLIFFTKITYISIVLIFLFLMIVEKKLLKDFKFYYLFCSIFCALFLMKNFFISSCLIFPIEYVCLNSEWAQSKDNLNSFIMMAKAFPRGLGNQNVENYFEYTLGTFQWFKPWFYEYFLKTSVIQLLLPFIFLSFIMLFDNKILKRLIEKQILIVIIIIFLQLILFFQAPAIRYSIGTLLIFSILIPVIFIDNQVKIKRLIEKNFQIFLFLIFFLIIIKNIFILDKPSFMKNILSKDLVIKIANNNESNFILKENQNGLKIYQSLDGNCYDLKELCVNFENKNFKSSNKNGYLFFSQKQ